MTAPSNAGEAEDLVGPVGFVGLGNIGRPMARRLLDWPDGLLVHDVDASAGAELVELGAKQASDPAELAREVGLLAVMVRDDDQVRQVLQDVLPAARPGLIIAVHSTVAPDTPGVLAEWATPFGVHLLDAPVSGGPMGATDGRLAMMVGGPADAFTRARPALALMASMLVHAGPVGAGTRFKLARNLLHFVSFTAAGEALRLAEAAGIDLVQLGQVTRHTDTVTGGPGAVMYRRTTAPIAPDEFWYGVFQHARALGEKDLGFAVELAEELGVDVPMARFARTGLGPALGLAPTRTPMDEEPKP